MNEKQTAVLRRRGRPNKNSEKSSCSKAAAQKCKTGHNSASKSRSITADFKCTTGGTAFKHGALNKVVSTIQTAYTKGEDTIYTFDELLANADLTALSSAVKEWLKFEALPQCDRIRSSRYRDGETRYEYNPPLPCRNKAELLSFLQQKQRDSGTGVLKSEIELSVPHAERVLKSIADEICVFTRQDKDTIIIYAPPDGIASPKPSWFTKLLPNVSVYGVNDEKIGIYLRRNGFKPAREEALTSGCERNSTPRRRKLPNRKPNFRCNDHVEELETYT